MKPESDSRYVICCGNLRAYVDAAQVCARTAYPVVELDRALHSEPPKMRDRLCEALAELPAGSTALIAMGFCGGSWEGIACPCRVVIPHVDDCITLVMHTEDRHGANLKEPGHFYLANDTQRELSPEVIRENLCREHGESAADIIMEEWFRNYVSLDVVDTGLNRCHTPEYVAMAERNAALIGTPWQYVPGSNLVLEKLLKGDWDGDFRVYEPGETVTGENFLPPDALYFRYASH